MKNNILVIGGKGKTGRKVVQRLVDLGQEVRIGSRTENPSFDWERPETWKAALEGMDKVYITFQPDLAIPGAAKTIAGLVAEAKQQNVKKLVLLSGKGESGAEECEQVVIDSGLDYTIVRASWFNQNFSESFFLDPILAGHVALPQAQVKVPYVDTDDIADVAVEVLLNDKHNARIYELTGPSLWTFKEVVEEIAKAAGRTISFVEVSLPEYVKMLEEHGVPSDFIWLINLLFTEVLGNEANQRVSQDIEKVLGRKPIDFSDYVRKTATTGVWNPVVEA